MLLLAAAARPGTIEAATVDHRLRAESATEARMVAEICEGLDVPHATLAAQWEDAPESGVQEKARAERYRLLGDWAAERGLQAIATAHHLDDQAETLLMRLSRGAGLRGLAAMRPDSPLPSSEAAVRLIRPLLSWRRAELERVCEECQVEAAQDPSNRDDHYERVRTRRALSEADWMGAEAVGRSASHLGDADAAIEWAADREWAAQVTEEGEAIAYRPAAPAEIQRRIVSRAIDSLASEGLAEPIRGRELDRLLEALAGGRTATLRGVLCSGGDQEWRFKAAPPRR
jgi:tRNA(Ile)-lysidine synthase